MIRDTLKKAAGLFVEFDPSETAMPGPTKTVAEIVRDQPGPNLDEIKVPDPQVQAPTDAEAPKPQATPVFGEDGSINFVSIYSLANLPSVPFTAEQILELFSSLPADLPLESKRATIRVTLNAMAKSMGVTTEQVVADASRKLAALSAYTESFAKQAEDYVSRAEIEIMTLEEQIATKRAAIEAAKGKKQKVNDACVAEGNRLDDVLEFFSLDVHPSKHAGS